MAEDHKHFLELLIRGYAGDPSEPRHPLESGRDEAEAVARWSALHVARHLLDDCLLVPDPQNRVVYVQVTRVWKRWASHGEEDVDLEVWGRSVLSGSERRVHYLLKVQVWPRYFLRLSNWTRSLWRDVSGTVRQESGGRLKIQDIGHPQLFAIVRSAEQSGYLPIRNWRPPDCCRRALGEIRRILESGRALHRILVVSPFVGLLGMAQGPSPVELYSLATTDWELWAQAVRSVPELIRSRVLTVIELHLLEHRDGTMEGQFWKNMRQAFIH